jgi:hypothetical protein
MIFEPFFLTFQQPHQETWHGRQIKFSRIGRARLALAIGQKH